MPNTVRYSEIPDYVQEFTVVEYPTSVRNGQVYWLPRNTYSSLDEAIDSIIAHGSTGAHFQVTVHMQDTDPDLDPRDLVELVDKKRAGRVSATGR